MLQKLQYLINEHQLDPTETINGKNCIEFFMGKNERQDDQDLYDEICGFLRNEMQDIDLKRNVAVTGILIKGVTGIIFLILIFFAHYLYLIFYILTILAILIR